MCSVGAEGARLEVDWSEGGYKLTTIQEISS